MERNRFFARNPPPDTHRELFDVSQLHLGSYPEELDDGFEEGQNDFSSSRRNLWPKDPPPSPTINNLSDSDNNELNNNEVVLADENVATEPATHVVVDDTAPATSPTADDTEDMTPPLDPVVQENNQEVIDHPLATNMNEVTIDSLRSDSGTSSHIANNIITDIQPGSVHRRSEEGVAASFNGAPPGKKPRCRFSFSKKFLHGSAGFYLSADPNHPLPSSTPDLLGQLPLFTDKSVQAVYCLIVRNR
jgi:hypothetical protein